MLLEVLRLKATRPLTHFESADVISTTLIGNRLKGRIQTQRSLHLESIYTFIYLSKYDIFCRDKEKNCRNKGTIIK